MAAAAFLTVTLLAVLTASEAVDEVLVARVAQWQPQMLAAARGLYGDDADRVTNELIARALAAHHRRDEGLVRLDQRRLERPDWFQQTDRVGYMAYADRFGGDLAGVRERLPYLGELGVNVVHLLSVLTPRDGENDGGFAISDYREPDPRLGTIDQLVELTTAMRDADMSLCLDFVLNHTADDHPWAVAARDGSEYHQNLYITFDDRDLPDEYEATLPEVFPQLAPGNFTWVPAMRRWVWTTFREFQWDLNWANPDVAFEMAEIAFHLANVGVDVLRLDAIAFTWKRLGTNCQNQPEAHLVAQLLRAAVGIAAPATILLAEAIVGPNDLVGYLGKHDQVRRECELAYHNQLMVQGWSMLASRRANLARVALGRLPDAPSNTAWVTYVRCHDDIGWAIDDADAAACGVTGSGHRGFLAEFYRGDFWESFARGVPFASNPLTGDERTSGMASTLSGVAAALADADPAALDLGLQRMFLLYALAFGYGGLPMIYMGDEIAQSDDPSFLSDPTRANDTRWAHRPAFDDDVAGRRHTAETLENRLFVALRDLIVARRGCPPLHAGAASHPIDVGHQAVFAWRRDHPIYGTLIGLANIGAEAATFDPLPEFADAIDHLAVVRSPVGNDATTRELHQLAPYQVRWIAAASPAMATMPPVAHPIRQQ